jgi:hypothetical protein
LLNDAQEEECVVQWGGLLTMGLGGVVSAIGGIVFLVLLIVALRARRRMQRGQV